MLKSVEDDRTVAIEGVVVVKRDSDGKLKVQKATDHSTRSGLKWGVVGGIALGVLFPPAIIASAVAVGAAGGAVGKIRQLHHRSELADELEDAIDPGHSGIIALVSDPRVVEIRNALAKADSIVQSAVDDAAADEIKAAAGRFQRSAVSSGCRRRQGRGPVRTPGPPMRRTRRAPSRPSRGREQLRCP